MAGLTSEGFTPLTLEEIQERIKTRLDLYNPGFDFTPESPDGQLVDIFSVEIAQAWSELGLCYSSFDPNTATGQALRNIGFISGVPYGVATRSFADITLVGTAGTVVPALSEVSDADGNVFQLESDAVIPATVPVLAQQAGPVPIGAGALVNIDSTITGWTSFTQAIAGTVGEAAQTDTAYRNLRNLATNRNHSGVVDAMQARLLELGILQATVINNDTAATLSDGTPPYSIHVVLGDIGGVSDADIAKVILDSKGLGIPTHGNSTSVVIEDSQGTSHTINFTKAVAVDIYIDLDVTFLSEDIAGAEASIRADLVTDINSYLAGEDVIWSRLFGVVTPYGKAQVNSLTVGRVGALSAANVVLVDGEYATTIGGDIAITVT